MIGAAFAAVVPVNTDILPAASVAEAKSFSYWNNNSNYPIIDSHKHSLNYFVADVSSIAQQDKNGFTWAIIVYSVSVTTDKVVDQHTWYINKEGSDLPLYYKIDNNPWFIADQSAGRDAAYNIYSIIRSKYGFN